MDSTYVALATGTAHDNDEPEFYQAVADRFRFLLPYLRQKEGEYIYDGNRCAPENLGWRVRQIYNTSRIEYVLNGMIDDQIIATWHEAASAEHWYTREKDWGWED